MVLNLDLDKSQKPISKRVKRSFHGYPMISIQYFGQREILAKNKRWPLLNQQMLETFYVNSGRDFKTYSGG
ncbi:MAG: acid phosphatase class B [Paraglaciecola sp.]|jgi:acid phosphatase class B